MEAHLDRDLDRGRAVVGEEAAREARGREAGERLGELERGRVREAGEQHVLEAPGLRGERRVDARVRVAEEVHPPRADAVEVAPALEVVQPYALAALDRHERQALVVVHLRAGMPHHREVARRDLGIGRPRVHGGECMRLEAPDGAG